MIYAAGHAFSTGYRGFRKASLYYCFLTILWLFSGFSGTPVSAQDQDDLLKAANEYFAKEQYHTAAQYYQVAVGFPAEDPKTAYRLAQCYRAIFNYSLAAHYYQRSMELDEVTYPLTPFYLAQMQKSMGFFKKAKDGFEYFIKTNTPGSFIPNAEQDNFIRQAKVEIEGCAWAIDQLGKLGRDIGFTNLPEPVNSNSNDYAAVTAVDDQVVTITSGRKGVRGGLVDNRFGEYFTDNFRYVNEGNLWTSEHNSDHFDRTNTKFSDGVGTYNQQGDRYYFTSCYEGSAFCKLYVTYKKKGVWKTPVVLNQQVNAPGYDNKHPTLTSGGDTLIFVSNRPGGPGGNDIWYSVSKNGDNWETPKPLPGAINTPFNEASPYCYQGNLLFFSSDGHKGMGGMDIFMVKGYQNADHEIQNLGTPFNSGFDDSFFSLGVSRGYLSSNRPNGRGNFDIYSFNLPPENTDLSQFLEESAESTQLRSRIRTNDGSSLYSARDEDQFYYDNLTAEERARLDRIIIMKQQTLEGLDSKMVSTEDYKYYKKLDISAKATIERLAHKQAMELEGLTSGAQMITQERLDWEFYQNINDGEKAIIDRIINVRVKGRRNVLSRLSREGQLYTSSSTNQERILNKVQLKSMDHQLESLREQHQEGIEQFEQNQLVLSKSSDNLLKPKAITEIALSKSVQYLNLVETLGYSHQLYYQELSPTDRNNLHQSAVRQSIMSNGQLTPKERNAVLVELGLESDPMYLVDPLNTSQYQMSQDIKQALADNLFTMRGASTEYSFMEQITVELDAQQIMLQEQLDLLIKKETHTRNLQIQLQQTLKAQESASSLILEQTIVDQFYSESKKLLPLLTPKDSYYFNTLDLGRQMRLDRLALLVNSQNQEHIMVSDDVKNYVAGLTPTDQWFYQQLSQEEQVIIDELVARGWSPEVPYSNEQQEFIAGLSVTDRDRINRMKEVRRKFNPEDPDNSIVGLTAYGVSQSTEQVTSEQSLSIDQSTSQSGLEQSSSSDQPKSLTRTNYPDGLTGAGGATAGAVVASGTDQITGTDQIKHSDQIGSTTQEISSEQSSSSDQPKSLTRTNYPDGLTGAGAATAGAVVASGTDQITGTDQIKHSDQTGSPTQENSSEQSSSSDQPKSLTRTNYPNGLTGAGAATAGAVVASGADQITGTDQIKHSDQTGSPTQENSSTQVSNLEGLKGAGVTSNPNHINNPNQPTSQYQTDNTDNSISSNQTQSLSKHPKPISYLGASVYFDFDSQTLRSEAKETLDELVGYLKKQQSPVKILVEGHTDNIGSASYNQKLGMRRSLTVARYVQPYSDRIELSTKSYGEHQMATDNYTPMSRQMNRRVELQVRGILYKSALRIYLVKPKATLKMIATATGIDEDQVLKWNGLTDHGLRAYQPLRLPVDLDYSKIQKLLYFPYKYQASSKTVKYHMVLAGENLFRLAMKYQTSVQVLEDLNDMVATDLQAGQRLRVH